MWLAFVPFACFLLACAVGAVGIWRVLRNARVTRLNGPAGRGIRIETPFGAVEMEPGAELDPILAQIPIYPGASRADDVPESITKLKLHGNTLTDISTHYHTQDDLQKVWEFYRAFLPSWEEANTAERGRELMLREEERVRLVRMHREAGWTEIELSLKPLGYPEVPSVVAHVKASFRTSRL